MCVYFSGHYRAYSSIEFVVSTLDIMFARFPLKIPLSLRTLEIGVGKEVSR